MDVPTSDRFRIRVFANDHIGRHLYLSGSFDYSIVHILCKFARPGDTLLDIGANIGYVSACFLAKVVGSQVISVEPQPDLICLLRHNLSQFGEDRAQIAPAAISEETKDGWMSIRKMNRGASALTEDGDVHATPVQVWSADKLFAQVKTLDLVKIDVEGHEETIIRASLPYFAQHRPRAIIFEDHLGKSGPHGSIGSMLSGIGYKIFAMRKRLTKIDLLDHANVDVSRFGDYVARLI
jgi:FkbM family methyltransferase